MIGWLLAGGGSRGIVQLGMCLALRDLKIEYDRILSSSAGTLNSLLVHSGDYDRLTNLWLNIKPPDVFEDRGPIDLALSYRRRYIHGSAPLRRLIDKSINYQGIVNNPKDFWINTTDLTNNLPYSRECKTFANQRELVDFAYASASPPIYFPTVMFQGRELCDSGVINNYSITESIAVGCDTLILMLPAKSPKNSESSNIVELTQKIIALSMQSYLDREAKSITKINSIIDTVQSAIEKSQCKVILEDKNFPHKIKLIIVYPEKESTFSFLDFNYKGVNRQDLITYGYNRCKSIIEAEWH